MVTVCESTNTDTASIRVNHVRLTKHMHTVVCAFGTIIDEPIKCYYYQVVSYVTLIRDPFSDIWSDPFIGLCAPALPASHDVRRDLLSTFSPERGPDEPRALLFVTAKSTNARRAKR